MDRNLSMKYIPTCPRNIGIVNQYSWPQKDTNKYMCHNGISHPIYDCKGDINFTLPLEMYPPVNHVHPQISMVRRPHLQYRGNPKWPTKEGFYYTGPFGYYGLPGKECPSRSGFVKATQQIFPGKLPDQSGWAAGRSACNSC